jgi:hypothetical protein
VGCQYTWKPEDVAFPGECPSCGQRAATIDRCEDCPVLDIEHYRSVTATGQLLDRVLEHDFDCKHYHIDPGGIDADVREGLKVLEQERSKWEKESRDKAEQEREERRRVQEMQRRG